MRNGCPAGSAYTKWPSFGVEVRSWLEQSGTRPDCRFVRSSGAFDVQVEMVLLGRPIRPFGRNVAGRELHADAPLARGIDDGVETVVFEDVPAEDSSPERSRHAGRPRRTRSPDAPGP